MPGFVPPQLASLRSKPPAGDNWLHEIKYDGYRLQIHLDKGRVTIRTRTGLDWTKRFSAIAAAFDIPVDRAIFDGEVVAVKDGRTNFSELQAALAAGRQEALTFNVFEFGASLVWRFAAGHFADSRGPKQAAIIGLIAAAAAGVLYPISFFLADVPAVSLAILLAGRAVLGGAESFMISGVLNWGLALAGPGNRPAAVGHN